MEIGIFFPRGFFEQFISCSLLPLHVVDLDSPYGREWDAGLVVLLLEHLPFLSGPFRFVTFESDDASVSRAPSRPLLKKLVGQVVVLLLKVRHEIGPHVLKGFRC